VKVIFKGELLDQAETPCNDMGWLPEVGIFETIKTVDALPWALTRHMRRAVRSAPFVGAKIPDEEKLRACVQVLLEEQVQPLGLMRLSFSSNGDWLAVHLPYTELTQPARVMVHPDSIALEGAQIKQFPYDHRISIVKNAQSKGFDEAIVVNASNNVSAAGTSNVLFKIKGKWCTPPLSDGVLPGVVRALVLENCDVGVRSIDGSEIKEIESALLIGSLRIAQSVEAIDGEQLLQTLDFKHEIEAMARRTSVG
jgi:branched-chain amino acid aminotransferase